MFTNPLPAEAVAMKYIKRGNAKQEIITRNWTYELPHELPNNLGLKILGNEELLRVFTWFFIDLLIRGFEVVTRGFELVTRGFKPVTHGVELALLKCF